MIALGSLLYSVAVAFILEPAEISPGGITGIAVIIHKAIGIPSGVIISLLNIPLIILGFIHFGGGFIIKTAVCVLMASSFLNTFEILDFSHGINPLICGLVGGLALGGGIGLIMSRNSTTGGVDIAVKLLNKKSTKYSIGSLFLIIDTIVIVIATAYYKNYTTAIYSTLAVFISSVTIDRILKIKNIQS